MYSLPKWAMLSTGQSRAGACPGYFAKAGSVLREGELDDDDGDYDDDDGDGDDDGRGVRSSGRAGQVLPRLALSSGKVDRSVVQESQSIGFGHITVMCSKKVWEKLLGFWSISFLITIRHGHYKDTSVDT